MKKEIIITYEWWNDDRTEIPVKHHEPLEEDAEERISAMVAEGYTSGELHTAIETPHKSGGIVNYDYTGWWSRTTKTI